MRGRLQGLFIFVTSDSMLSNKTYDVLKWIALYLLPALGTLCFALAGIWNFPYGEEVVGTITAVDTFLGVLLGISTAQYKRKKMPRWMMTDMN